MENYNNDTGGRGLESNRGLNCKEAVSISSSVAVLIIIIIIIINLFTVGLLVANNS